MRRIAILGNSGSGKTTLSHRLAATRGLARLELDDLVWQPGQVAVQRPLQDVAADLDRFLATHPAWVAEGCYGDLLARLLPACDLLLFLDPGEQACLAHCRSRPWEPHKYATPEAQEAMLETLLEWVRGYYLRDDPWSHRQHLALFEAHAGAKRRLVDPAQVRAMA
jgi:adenylate kinase family enzyme